MNFLGLFILCISICVVLLGSRRWATLAMVASVLYLTQNQHLTIGGVNFYAVRFVELAGFARVVLRKEFLAGNLNSIDRFLIFLYCYTTIIFLFRSEYDQAYQVGIAVDAFLSYFAFRGLIKSEADFRWFLRKFVLLLLPYAFLVTLESVTRYNIFSYLGASTRGVWERGGRIRCYGSFQHPSLLGTLGGAFLPLYIGFGLLRNSITIAAIGALSCLAIILASNSGGPANCAAIGILGWLLWGLRKNMKLVRRSILLVIVSLGVLMKAPIWYLPARASSLSGGDGWHRSYLMEMAYKNLGHWWAAGMAIKDTRDWFPYVIESTGGADITNVYLSWGLTAGLPAMAFFIWLLVKIYSRVGKSLAQAREKNSSSIETEYILWSLGVAVTVHIFNWLGIIYFDQTYILWFMQLAILVGLTDQVLLMPNTALSGPVEVAANFKNS